MSFVYMSYHHYSWVRYEAHLRELRHLAAMEPITQCLGTTHHDNSRPRPVQAENSSTDYCFQEYLLQGIHDVPIDVVKSAAK